MDLTTLPAHLNTVAEVSVGAAAAARLGAVWLRERTRKQALRVAQKTAQKTPKQARLMVEAIFKKAPRDGQPTRTRNGGRRGQ